MFYALVKSGQSMQELSSGDNIYLSLHSVYPGSSSIGSHFLKLESGLVSSSQVKHDPSSCTIWSLVHLSALHSLFEFYALVYGGHSLQLLPSAEIISLSLHYI